MHDSNLTTARPTFVTHLECSETGARLPADQLHNLSPAGKPLLVRYDLSAASRAVDPDALARRPADLWRYRELLPVRECAHIASLGEIMTPILPLHRYGPDLWVKDEGRLPTGSFKARGLCMAVSMASALGVRRMAMPTNGNAGAALAAYCRAAGLEAFVFCPADTPEVNIREIALQGATVWTYDGLINECGALVGAGKEAMGWFDVSTLKEPYRIEGKKTMGLELAEQFGWTLPDVIFYPTGGGTGLIGMWKAFAELEALGWIGAKRPRMVAVQAEGCAPIVKAWQAGARHAELEVGAHTVAAGIRVPAAIGDFLILDAVRESDGFAIAVSDAALLEARDRVAGESGMLLCPEGAATFAAWERAVAEGLVDRQARALLFNCATGLKYPMPAAGIPLPRGAQPDYGPFLSG
ncbi:MAG: threonine synthase [Pseudomonadales bacterium]|nr:threonine synthase [Pseudomonadales bacterium]